MGISTAARNRRRPVDNGKNAWHGMILFVIAEALLFFGLLYAFFYFRTTGGQWPPAGVTLDLVVPTINLLLLAMSSVLIRWAGSAARANQQDVLKGALLATMLLGLLFIGGQVVEYLRLNLSLAGDVFTSVFYMIIGFHALHVVIGVGILAVVTLRAWMGVVSPQRRLAVQSAELYWHFVVAAWVVLFIVLYLA